VDRRLTRRRVVGDRDRGRAGTALLGIPFPGVIHEHLTHHPRGQRKEVCPVMRGHGVCPHQPEIGLMDKRRGLQGVVRRVCSEASPGDPAELVVDKRQQAIVRIAVAVAPLTQKNGDLVFRGA
jgi:hypothetical protein